MPGASMGRGGRHLEVTNTQSLFFEHNRALAQPKKAKENRIKSGRQRPSNLNFDSAMGEFRYSKASAESFFFVSMLLKVLVLSSLVKIGSAWSYASPSGWDFLEQTEHGTSRRTQVGGGGEPDDIRYGTLYTDAGYDRESGVEPVCWRQEGPPPGYNGTTVRAGGTLDRFSFQALPNRHFMLSSCGDGVKLNAHIRNIPDVDGVLRTNQTYNFRVQGHVDLTTFAGHPDSQAGYMEYPPPSGIVTPAPVVVAVLCILCDPLLAGLCTPYTHSQSTARLRAMGVEKPWAYEYGERHGGTHIHSKEGFVVKIEADQTKVDIDTDIFMAKIEADQTKLDIDMDIEFKVNEEGSFYGICTLQFLTTNATNPTSPAYGWDIANVIDEHKVINRNSLLNFKHPMEVLKVENGTLIASIVIIVIAALMQVAMLVYLVYKRTSQVFKLCQGKFLVVFLVSSIVSTVCSIFFNPKNDLYCNLTGPAVLIPLQLMVSILIGLIWRIHTLISPLLSHGGMSTENTSWLSSLFQRLALKKATKSRNLRVKVSEGELLRLILIFTFPQVIIQTLSLTLGQHEYGLLKNEEKTKAREICIAGDEPYNRVWWYLGLANFAGMCLVMIAMAWRARELPSLLNEAMTIFDALVTTAFVVMVGIFMIVLTQDPDMSPEIEYLAQVLMVLSFTLNLSVRIVLPKLKLAWTGERIIVNKLVGLSSYGSHDSKSSYASNSGISYSQSSSPMESTASQAEDTLKTASSSANLEDSLTASPGESPLSEDDQKKPSEDAQESKNGLGDNEEHGHGEKRKGVTWEKGINKAVEVDGVTVTDNKNNKHRAMVIQKGEPVPRKLLLEMIQAADVLKKVNQRVISGFECDEEDWERARSAASALNAMFTGVKFQWEAEA